MKRTPVTNSKIAAVGYDPANLTMDLEFVNHGKVERPNSVYRYSNVSQADYAALMAAESKGKHFGTYIKPNATKFPFRKLTAEEAA